MDYKILAKSQSGSGILPMKESEELEKLKSGKQKSEEFCNFIKNAFCADGEVLLIQSKKPFTSKEYFLVEDSKRGMFAVSIKKI